jgi:hypothetical protein
LAEIISSLNLKQFEELQEYHMLFGARIVTYPPFNIQIVIKIGADSEKLS